MTAALVLYSLDAALASDLTKRFFLYLPNLVVGVTIFFVGILTARVVSRSVLIGAVNRGLPAAKLLAAADARRASCCCRAPSRWSTWGSGGRSCPPRCSSCWPA